MRLPRLLRDALRVQRRIVEAARDADVTDECLATYLAEAEVPKVSRSLVSRWANDEDPRWMGLHHLLGALRIVGPSHRHKLLQPLCDAADGLFVALPADQGEHVFAVRSALALGGLVGRLQDAVLDAQHPDSEGGEEITEDERDLLVATIDDVLRKLTAMRASLTGAPGAIRMPR